MKKFISLFIFCLIIWILLAGINISELIIGGLVSLTVSLFLSKTTVIEFGFSIILKALIFIGLYIPVFLWQLIKSNIDVAFRVLSPKIPLNPGFVKVPVAIKSNTGKLILANSITLTPGTISVDGDDEYLYVHWIDVKKKDGEIDTDKVSEPFEKILRRLFK